MCSKYWNTIGLLKTVGKTSLFITSAAFCLIREECFHRLVLLRHRRQGTGRKHLTNSYLYLYSVTRLSRVSLPSLITRLRVAIINDNDDVNLQKQQIKNIANSNACVVNSNVCDYNFCWIQITHYLVSTKCQYTDCNKLTKIHVYFSIQQYIQWKKGMLQFCSQ